MKDRNGNKIYEGQIVHVCNHPEEFMEDSWVVLDFLSCMNQFVLQHFITHEIKIFSQSDVERTF